MKKVTPVLMAIVFCALLLAGCSISSQSRQGQPLAVYSFSGENEFISVSNGVIVLDAEEEICYGGNLETRKDKFTDIASYSATIYFTSDGEENILMSNRVEDKTGGAINISEDIGKITGDILIPDDIDNLVDDLKRRDFTMNTLCIDSNGNIIDLFSSISDIQNRVVKMIGNPKIRLKEDSLRILRAIRFATVLDFELDEELKKYIKKYGYLLKKLSKNRRKEELNKIFSSPNILKGINYLKELNLVEYLELVNFDNVKITSSIIGVWAQVGSNYSFSNHELEMIKQINELLNKDLYSPYNLYYYGLYFSHIVGEIKDIDKKIITKLYNDLPIHSRKDIDLNGKEIMDILSIKDTSKIKIIVKDLEVHILSGSIINNKDVLINYVLKKYK